MAIEIGYVDAYAYGVQHDRMRYDQAHPYYQPYDAQGGSVEMSGVEMSGVEMAGTPGIGAGYYGQTFMPGVGVAGVEMAGAPPYPYSYGGRGSDGIGRNTVAALRLSYELMRAHLGE